MTLRADVLPAAAGLGRGAQSGLLVAAVTLALAGCVSTGEESAEQPTRPVASDFGPRTIDFAERAVEEGRYKDAGKLLERVILVDPENVQAKLLGAEVLLAIGSTRRAAASFGELAGDPEVGAKALQGEGIARMLDGDEKEGYELLRRAVDADPDLWRAWNALGSHHDSLGQWEAATESYDRALAANPNSEFVYNNRGYSKLMQSQWDEAVEDLSRAVLIDPDFELARSNLRLTLAWKGRYASAVSGASEKEMSSVLNNVGFVAILRGDYANAETYLLRAMEADSSYNETASKNLTYLKSMQKIDKDERPEIAAER